MDGVRYELAGPSLTRIRVHASLFTVRLSVVLELWNMSESPLLIKPYQISVVGLHGALVGGSSGVLCEGHPETQVSILRGESCRMRATFSAPQARTELASLTLIREGLARGDENVRLSVPLEIHK
jgi:hypothetical protein